MPRKKQHCQGRARIEPATGYENRPSPVDKHVGDQLRRRRVQLEYSSHELALTVNIEPEVIEQCEQGQSTITAGLLHQLASALTVPVSYFFEQLPEPNRCDRQVGAHNVIALSPPAAMTIDNPQAIALMRAFLSISDSSLRHCLLGLVQDLHPEQEDDPFRRPYLVG